MLWVPTARLETSQPAKDVTPLLVRGREGQIVVTPSRMLTVPVGALAPPIMLTASVTVWPFTAVASLDVIANEVSGSSAEAGAVVMTSMPPVASNAERIATNVRRIV